MIPILYIAIPLTQIHPFLLIEHPTEQTLSFLFQHVSAYIECISIYHTNCLSSYSFLYINPISHPISIFIVNKTPRSTPFSIFGWCKCTLSTHFHFSHQLPFKFTFFLHPKASPTLSPSFLLIEHPTEQPSCSPSGVRWRATHPTWEHHVSHQ